MNRVFGLLLMCLFAFQIAEAQTRYQKVVAHRAGIWDTDAIPENSIAALRESSKIGVHIIEIDVHLSKDNIVIVNHDHDFQGMDIATHTYEELVNHAKLSNGEKLPTLTEYIQEIQKHPGLKLWIDIKRSNVDMARDVLTGKYVAKTILETQSEDVSEVIAPMFTAMIKIKMEAPKVRLHYIGTQYSPETLQLLGFDGVNLSWKRYETEYDMQGLKNIGMEVGAYTVDDPEVMKMLLEKDVDYITTNRPKVLIDIINNMNK